MALFEKNAHRFDPSAGVERARQFSWDRYVREMRTFILERFEGRRARP